jgi:hypothetical protein
MIALLHTAPAHIETFDALLSERDEPPPVRHYVEEGLLRLALTEGGVTPEMEKRTEAAVREIDADGAAAILCTCSTIGPCAERLNDKIEAKILRVDRPMATKAVALGRRIALVATLGSTIPSTRSLLLEEAERAGKEIEILELLCESAWALFERGDRRGYLRAVAERILSLSDAPDAAVLAQASLLGVEDLCGTFAAPVLSSPRTGLEAAIRWANSPSDRR